MLTHPLLGLNEFSINKDHALGFTLIELLVTMAILAILMSVATPSFRESLMNAQVRTVANKLMGDVNFARAEAVKQSAAISVVASAGGWTNGWQVSDASVSPAKVLRIHGAVPQGYSVQAGRLSLVFNGNGGVQTPGTINFAVCRPDKKASQARLVSVSGAGQAVVHRDISGSGLSCP